ncbi:uncharacterized protein LOC114516940 isoform X1 [Dendronephthya gigantea]|uniref:uncharacterized protein LOC114516940 isoform X1 n=1 Tax=Dendronephthya gigantea TaxID=151771 RepID=UPI00106C35EC|nr:uncharacterized protein LOC114516940 isoform X1 [Dendronephthya gigantea]
MSTESEDRVLPPPELDWILPEKKEIGSERYEWLSDEIQSRLPIDILLVTATDHEFNSCYSFLRLKPIRRSWCPDMGLGFVDFGEFDDGNPRNTNVTVALMRCEAGPLPAVIVVKNATEVLKPKAVLFVGVCAALDREKAKLGDVIISAKLANHAFKKVKDDGKYEHRGFKENVSRNMAKLILSADHGWEPPIKNKSGFHPKVNKKAVMLSGPELIDYDKRRLQLLEDFPDADGLEMEGEGLFAAAYDLGIEWAVIKGVSDFADGSKRATEDWQPFSSTMAASLVYNMFKSPDVTRYWPHYQKTEVAVTRTSLSFRMLSGFLLVLIIGLLACYVSFWRPLPDFPERAVTPTPLSIRMVAGCLLALIIGLLVLYVFRPMPPPHIPEKITSPPVPTNPPFTPIEQFLRGIAGTKEGRREYNGRMIEYSVSGRVHSFDEPWVYDGTAKDVESGIFAKKKHFEHADEAINAAIEELVKKLKERKILQDQST